MFRLLTRHIRQIWGICYSAEIDSIYILPVHQWSCKWPSLIVFKKWQHTQRLRSCQNFLGIARTIYLSQYCFRASVYVQISLWTIHSAYFYFSHSAIMGSISKAIKLPLLSVRQFQNVSLQYSERFLPATVDLIEKSLSCGAKIGDIPAAGAALNKKPRPTG